MGMLGFGGVGVGLSCGVWMRSFRSRGWRRGNGDGDGDEEEEVRKGLVLDVL
jgi:hypothetical protein